PNPGRRSWRPWNVGHVRTFRISVTSEPFDERVSDRQGGKSREVAIGAPQLPDAVVEADRRYPGIVHAGPCDPGGHQQIAELLPGVDAFTKQPRGWCMDPHIELVGRLVDSRRAPERAWVRHNRNKLADAWPWDTPGRSPGRQVVDQFIGALVVRELVTVCVHQKVRIERDHTPRSS